MRKVIDTNQLQSQALRIYLSASPKNFAVLTDYVAMEAHKGDTLTSIYRSMEILGDFPSQVIVLKNTRVTCGLSGRGSGLQKRLIDEGSTSKFPRYIQHLQAAKRGNLSLQRQLLDYGKEATDHLARMLVDAETTGVAMEEIATMYSKEERSGIRTGQPYPAAMVDHIVSNIIQISGLVFGAHPSVKNRPNYEEIPNTYIFRVALCTYLLALEWGARGGVRDASPTKLRNDFVDMNIAAYATYFDGLMSVDAKVLRIHQEARIWLSALFGTYMHGGVSMHGGVRQVCK